MCSAPAARTCACSPARVPSLNIESSFGRAFPRFYIRGFGNTDFDLNASQPVSLIYDDVVQENPILKGFPVFDLEKVEMLRGPQGTLFGRNTPAGVIKFDSVRPRRTRRLRQRLRRHVQHHELRRRRRTSRSVKPGRRASPGSTSIATTGSTTRSREETSSKVTTRARPACSSSTRGDDFTALINVHMRSLDGTARLFRANIIQSGTNNLIEASMPNRSRSTATTTRNSTSAAAVCSCTGISAAWRCTRSPATSPWTRTAAATSTAASAAGSRPAERARASSHSPAKPRTACPRSSRSPRSSASNRNRGCVQLAGRPVLLRRGLRHRELQLRHAGRRRSEPVPARQPGQHGLGGVRLR